MKLRMLEIRNFRGIESLASVFPNSATCLIGPGDSTKTTILDAIEYALTSRWHISLDDSDFYNSDTNKPIEIIVTIGELPEELLSEFKFGLLIRGWSSAGNLNDEPKEGDEAVLSIRLKVDSSLEPVWTVFNDRFEDGKVISSKDRELLSMYRLDSQLDRHFTFGRGSTLSRLTGKLEDAATVLSEANRQAQKSAKLEDIDIFMDAIRATGDAAKKFGVKSNALKVKLDTKTISIGSSAISIYSGETPLRLLGLGSRKLLALGLQLNASKDGSIILIDEIELGLEPHRICHLIKTLSKETNGQVIMTSHSAVAIAEIGAEKIGVVRSNQGKIKVSYVPSNLQDTIRAVPEALLSSKIIVCEGKTELGICRQLEDYWKNEGKDNFAYIGITTAFGGGEESARRALNLTHLGYETCLFIDGDKLDTLDPSLDILKAHGVSIFYWADNKCTEERVASDLPVDTLLRLVEIAKKVYDEQSVLSKLRQVFETKGVKLSIDEVRNLSDLLLNQQISIEQMRIVVGQAAKDKWFKSISRGESLGKVIVDSLNQVPESDLANKVDKLKKWIYGDNCSQ